MINKLKILVDVTEPPPLFDKISALCKQKNIEVEKVELRYHKNVRPETKEKNPFICSGVDYIVVNDALEPVLAIERKTYKDLVLSIIQKEEKNRGRLFRQLDSLKKFPESILILEGRLPERYTRFEGHVYGAEYWCYRNGIGVIHTPDLVGSAKAICLLAQKKSV